MGSTALIGIAHGARAHAHMAHKEWDKALADAIEVAPHLPGTDGSMSLRTDELDESEALSDENKKHMK